MYNIYLSNKQNMTRHHTETNIEIVLFCLGDKNRTEQKKKLILPCFYLDSSIRTAVFKLCHCALSDSPDNIVDQ